MNWGWISTLKDQMMGRYAVPSDFNFDELLEVAKTSPWSLAKAKNTEIPGLYAVVDGKNSYMVRVEEYHTKYGKKHRSIVIDLNDRSHLLPSGGRQVAAIFYASLLGGTFAYSAYHSVVSEFPFSTDDLKKVGLFFITFFALRAWLWFDGWYTFDKFKLHLEDIE